MTTKIICIDRQHAEGVHANTSFDSVILGRAVVINIEPWDSQVPQILQYGMGFLAEVTDFDRGELYGKPAETN